MPESKGRKWPVHVSQGCNKIFATLEASRSSRLDDNLSTKIAETRASPVAFLLFVFHLSTPSRSIHAFRLSPFALVPPPPFDREGIWRRCGTDASPPRWCKRAS